jgi:Protein of unknown function (DUF1579)
MIGTWEAEAPEPRPEHRRLEVFIGKWINEGETVPVGGTSPARILTSDVYEWIPGRFAVLHTAYGRMGELDVGGVEIIGYDAESGTYTSHFFDSQGLVTSTSCSTTTAGGSGAGSESAQRRRSATTARCSTPSTSSRTTASTGVRPWT